MSTEFVVVQGAKVVGEEPCQAVSKEQATDGHATVGIGGVGSASAKTLGEAKAPAPVQVKRSISEGEGLHVERPSSDAAKGMG
jgi:hypothetical protein